jgi:hypothetical protein
MSIIKNIEVDLSDVVNESDLILTVEYLEPFTEEVAVKSIDPNVPAPSFNKEGFVFTVKTILKNADKIAVPLTISVPKENWRRSLSQHKEWYAGGPSKSYGVKEYKPEESSMRKANILFLYHFQGTFELVVKNSFESIRALEKITMLIAATA